MSRIVRPFSVLSRVLELYWLFYCFIAISIIVLPLVIIVKSLAMCTTIAKQLCFLPLFARMHRPTKIVVYSTIEFHKRIPHAMFGPACKRKTTKHFLFLYMHFYIGCITCYKLLTKWVVFRTILLSGDVELNPGPDALDFGTWNLNSITAHDFLRVSLIEASNSVYKYDLIGIIETHFDSTINVDRLALDGYTFYK